MFQGRNRNVPAECLRGSTSVRNLDARSTLPTTKRWTFCSFLGLSIIPFLKRFFPLNWLMHLGFDSGGQLSFFLLMFVVHVWSHPFC